MNTETAYRACEEITRREAKNFGYGIRLLASARAPGALVGLRPGPAHRRHRRRHGDRRRRSSSSWPRSATASTRSAAETEDPVLVAVAAASRRYQLPLAAFDELIDGLRAGRARAPPTPRSTTWSSTAAWWQGPSVGSRSPCSARPIRERSSWPTTSGWRSSSPISCATSSRTAATVASTCRRRTPIAVGCPPDLSGNDAALAELVAFECARVHEWFERGLQLLPLLDRRSRACVGAMAGIYHRLLVHIERDPMAVTQRRLSLPAAEKVWIAGKCIVGARA